MTSIITLIKSDRLRWRRNSPPSILKLYLLFLFIGMQLSAFAQDVKPSSLNAIAEPYENIEFFVIKPELQFSKEQFISTHLRALQLAEGSEMKLMKSTVDFNVKGMTHHRYQQYVKGVRVEGGEMILHEQNGRIKYVNGQYMQAIPQLAFNPTPAISEETGLQTALSKVNATEYLWKNEAAEKAYKQTKKDPSATLYPTGELVFAANSQLTPETRRYFLCWRYNVNVEPHTESYTFYIDAQTGVVFNQIPLTYACSTGSGTTLWNGVKTIYTQLNAGTYRTIDDCITAQIRTYNGNGANTGVGATDYTDADNTWPTTNLGKYIVETQYDMRQTRNYYFSVHGLNGIDDLGHDYISYLNPGFSNNAYYSSGTETFSFGGTSTGANPVIELDVAAHEATHGVIDFSSGLAYQYESGALNESFADIFGESAEEYSLGANDWILANNIALGPLRSFSNPNAFTDPDTYEGTYWYAQGGCVPSSGTDYCGVHRNSGVQNFWYYLLTVGGSGTNDNSNAYSVTGIGINKARLIAYQSMINLTTNSTFANARSVSIQAAKDLYGNCSEEAEACTRAWYAVGVGANWVTPTPLTITVTTSAPYVCPGGSSTITAFGASTYTWSGGYGLGNPKVITPNFTSTYTVTGTDAEACTGTKSFTINVTPVPTVNPTADDYDLCVGQSTTIRANTNGTLQALTTSLAGGNGSSANAFDIQAYNSITITDFQMNISTGDSAEIYYNVGGYGNAPVTSLTGWFKLGQTVPITPAGLGNLTLIPTTSNLTIPAGQTYGILISVNGSNSYTNGTLVGSTLESNADLRITQGHGGIGTFGTVNVNNAPRNFNGEIIYRTNYTSYLWASGTTLSSTTSSIPTATPNSSTTYTLTATDGNGCTNTGTVRVYVNQGPDINSVLATPQTVCQGSSSNLSTTASSIENDNISTKMDANNASSGNVFDVTAIKDITINYFGIHATTGTQAEVWYKAGGYGQAGLYSSAGWTQLGTTMTLTPQGLNNLSLIFPTASLSIPAGQTYGIAIVIDGSLQYTNGTGVGDLLEANPDINIFQGHGGSGMGGAFSFGFSPRNFNGRFYYEVDNNIAGYFWSPSINVVNSTTANATATPALSTTYTLTVTDGDGCTNTALKRVYVGEPLQIQLASSLTSTCPGASQLITTTNANSAQSDEILTYSRSNNGYGPNGGVVFDVTTTRAITITSVKMNMDDDATQAEIWYKSGSYGGVDLTSSVGWTKLGATVAVTSQGLDALTTITPTASLSIPANSTYGLAIVCNGSVNYINGTSVGAVYISQPGISIKQGHGGAGFGGTFNFINAPRVFSGSLVYNETVSFSSYAWTPATNINSTVIASPTVSPSVNTSYSVTVTDANTCTGTASIGIQVMDTPTGIATATPASGCVGSAVSLSYANLAGNQCNGVVQSGFAGSYLPATWSTILTNSNGTVNTAGAPNSIVISSSNGLSGNGTTAYQHSMLCAGFLKFSWSYSSVDASPVYDYPRYSVNGGVAQIFPGFKAASGNDVNQAGSFSLPVNPGDIVQIQMYSSDNIGGAGTLTITNFRAPYQTTTTQSIAWYTVPTGGVSLSAANPYSYVPAAGSYTYYAQVTNTNTGCTNAVRTATNGVVISPFPTVTANASSLSICSGGSTTLNAGGATNYVWQPGGSTSSSLSVSPGATTTYTVTGTNAAGCSATSTVQITVNTTPTVSTSVTLATICSGQSTSLSASGASTYSWQPGALSGTPVAVSPASTTTYTVTGTAANGCTATATRLVTVNTSPTVGTTITNATICSGQSTSITGTGASTYSWQPGALSGTSVNVTPASTTTYTVTGTAANGCTGTATRLVTVNTTPTVTTSVTSATICSGQSTSLSASGASTYSWQPGALSGTPVVVSPASTTTYTVTGTAANGCTATATRLVTVNTSPTVGTTITNATICSGQSTSITGTGASTYSWQPGALSGTSVNVTPASTTTYTVTGTAANGCTGTATRLVTVNTTPTVTTSVTSATICSGQSTTLSASGASTYSWQPGALSGTPVVVSPGTTTTYTVTGTSASGCTATATRLVTVNTSPTVGTTITNATICSGQSTTITGTGASTYSWQPGALSGTSVNVTPGATTTYTVTGTAVNGCTGTATRLVTVNTTPTVTASATAINITCPNSTTLNASGATSYVWQPGGATGSSVVVSPATTTTYTVTGTNAAGCTATATRTITVVPCSSTTLNLTVFIEGYYIGGGLMNSVLQNQGMPNPVNHADSLTVELRSSIAPYNLAYSFKGVLATNGTMACTFPAAAAGSSYYIVLNHRNALQTWSNTPVLASSTYSYNFSNAANKAYGSNQVNLGGGVFGLYSGDLNQDFAIDAFDYVIIDADITAGASGYLATDLTGDGAVDAFDYILIDPNIINGVGAFTP